MSHDHPYASRITIPLRYADLDTLGHVNQAVYHVLLEEGRRDFFVGAAEDEEVRRSLGAVVVARVEIDHRHELRIEDGQAVVETTLQHVGRSSLRLASRIASAGGTVAAEAITVLVAWDLQTRGSRALSATERERLAALTTPAEPAA